MMNPDIVILDDNEDISLMMQSILQFAGYEAFRCSTREQLMTQLEAHKPKLILMDMLLSGTDGREVCRELKADASTKSIPIIMISAHPDAGVTCRDAGADAFLEKPFEMEALIQKTQELLKG